MSYNYLKLHCSISLLQVSEGTPSPSVLKEEPSFSNRKSLHYEDTSQDGHHASFEEERQIKRETSDQMVHENNSSDTKPIVSESEDAEMVPESSKARLSLPMPPVVDVKVESIKKEPEESSDVPAIPDTHVSGPTSFAGLIPKQERSPSQDFGGDMSSHETGNGYRADVKEEPMDVCDSSMAQSESLAYTEQSNEERSELSEVTDTQQEIAETSRMSPDVTESCGSNFIQDSNVDCVNAPSQTLTEIPGIGERVQSPSEDVASTQPEAEPYVPMEQVQSENPANVECENVTQSPPLDSSESVQEAVPAQIPDSVPNPSPEPHIPDIADANRATSTPSYSAMDTMLGIQTAGSSLETPEDATRVSTSLSPRSFSLLSKANLSVRQEPVEITPDVLEIGSNASTPTRDELPSPEDSLI